MIWFRSSLQVATLLVILFVTPTLRAATPDGAESTAQRDDASQTPTVDSPPAKDAGSDPQAATSKSDKNKRNNDIFQPSEEISEDFAVSFPVDI